MVKQTSSRAKLKSRIVSAQKYGCRSKGVVEGNRTHLSRHQSETELVPINSRQKKKPEPKIDNL